MKIYFCLILLCPFIFINSSINPNDQINNNINNNKIKSFNDIVVRFKYYYLLSFEKFKHYIKTTHGFIKDSLNILPPYDIVIFFSIGALIKIIITILFQRNKDTFVYNTEDSAESLYRILNSLNDISSSIITQLNNQVDQPEQKNQFNEIKEIPFQTKEIVNSLNNTMDDIASQMNYLKSVNDNLHEIIQSSQSAIIEELQKNNDDEDDEDENSNEDAQ